jgi:hypothetical protein
MSSDAATRQLTLVDIQEAAAYAPDDPREAYPRPRGGGR